MQLLLDTESLEPSLILSHSSLLLWLLKLPTFSNSTSFAALSMALKILLQTLLYCLTFLITHYFRNYATSRWGPSKIGNAKCGNAFACFKIITLTNREILLFLWSGTQIITSASRLSHFTACVQNGVYSSLPSAFLPLAMSTCALFSCLICYTWSLTFWLRNLAFKF
jgi:hypothetical protein